MDKQQTLNKFWSSFGIPAYDELTVPDDAVLPYITYETTTDDFGNMLSLSASVWYRSTSWADITHKADEIGSRLGRGGKMLDFDGGAVWISKGTPWQRRMADPDDDTVRRIVLNLNVEYMD